ncbi:MAG: PstS family phosphate ABC transporter substrate-binding protein [Candidatus Eutrophobiaceae bacterium]
MRIFLLAALLCFQWQWVQAAEKLPEYHPVRGISGNLNSVGSDTLANMMTLWTEQYRSYYRSVTIGVQAAGSSTAPPALIEGSSQLGPMSRKMKDKEIASFEKRYGYKPTAVPVAVDALVVFVNKDNPIESLSLPQVDAIFSKNRNCGARENVMRWGDLAGVSNQWSSRRIQLYGRNSASGTYGYFKKVALCNGDYKDSVNEQPGSASVVQSVSATLDSIGYSGIGYVTSEVRAVSLSKENGGKIYEPSAASAISGDYPLARLMYVYINKEPGKPLDPLIAEFLKMIYSMQGQKIVEKDGYIALPANVAMRTMKKLGI